jgi:formylglycine-generating enzyme required for sulfatase activity
MKNRSIFMAIMISMAALVLFSCESGGGGGDSSTPFETGFDTAAIPSDVATITVGSETVDMIYANNQAGIIFPFSPSPGTPVDNNPATLMMKFFMSETQVTNALMVQVLNWAKTNNKISESGTDNLVNATTVKYGNQELLDLDFGASSMKISYSTSTHTFTVATGYEDRPVVSVSWYGAIMFCNWLTEMRDGNTTNVVYTGIDTTWTDTETLENNDRTGYRLPSNKEWEYAARYIGTTTPTRGDLPTEYVAQSHNSGDSTLTAGYYWTPADYASGAIRDYMNETETRAVAWYEDDSSMTTYPTTNCLMPVAQKTANQLGLYDMSGNVWEWCFTASGSSRVARGGSWINSAAIIRLGLWSIYNPVVEYHYLGFRFARSH